MPAGKVIGRISVRVLPDTSDFKDKAKTDLERIEQQLKVTIGTKIDTTGARSEVLQAVRDINRDNRATDSRKIRFYTTVSTNGMRTAIDKAARELQSKANRADKISFEVGDLKATGKVELGLDQDSADQTEKDIDDWVKHVSPVKVDIELNFPTGATSAVNARLSYISRPRTVTFLPTLNEAAAAKVAAALAALSGIRVLDNMLSRFRDFLKDLDKSVPLIGTLATAMAGLAGWGLAAASNLASLSASLASIAPTALLLPGLLGGMAVGLGVTIAALKDFNKIVPEVKATLSDLQDAISENFWAKAAAPIREMVDSLLPAFTVGVEKTATQVGSFFAGFAEGLGNSLSPALGQMFTDLSESIRVATTGTAVFAEIIATLGKVGTSYLPQLAQWFVDISTQFNSWLQAKGENGLKAMIDEGIVALKDLGSILADTSGILAGVARAAEAAGGSTLNSLADSLDRIHATVDSPGFQEGLTQTFAAAHEAMQQIADISGPAVEQFFKAFAGLLQEILPQVGTTLGTALEAVASSLSQSGVLDGVKAMFDGIEDAVTALAPAMAPLGLALGAIMELVGAFAAMLGPLVSAALIPLSDAFAALAPAIIPVVDLLGGILTAAVEAVAPLLVQLAEGLAPIVSAFAEGLAPIIPVVSAAFQTVSEALMPLVGIFLQLLSAVLTPLIPVISSLVSSLLPPLADAISRAAEALQPLLSAFVALVDFLMPILVPILELIVEILVTAFTEAIEGAAQILEGFASFFKSVWDAISAYFGMWIGLFKGIFTGNWSDLGAAFDDFCSAVWGIWTSIWDMIAGAFKVVMNVGILSVGKKVLGLFKTAWKTAWAAIKTVAVELWSSVTTRWTSVMAEIRQIPHAAMTLLRQFWNSAWQDIKTACSLAWDAIRQGVRDSVGKVVTTVRELPSKAKTALMAIGSTLVDAGKKLIQGFIDGIKGMFNSVKDTLGGLTDKLTSWKGPARRDATLLTDAGRLVIDGFIVGLESRYSAVRKSLSGLTDDVASTDFTPPGVGQIRGTIGMSSLISGALSGTGGGGGITKVLNYYAAAGSSISAEEDLFGAMGRARAGW
ncbi:phage tail protein [Streptomyces nitrosporeus]|uniref:phage tail protein n=1 Tax=Streptomyces nitrosporeus TaxID=28894 RepID=UPI00331D5976